MWIPFFAWFVHFICFSIQVYNVGQDKQFWICKDNMWNNMVAKTCQLCRNPTFGRMWGWYSHSQNGDLGFHRDSIRTPENLEFDCKNQNTLHWGVLYTIRKIWKCICQKWAHISHLNICNTSYGKKKGRESNWQFDSRPLKVRNRPDLDVCKWSVTHRWKAFNKNYKFSSDLIPIEGLSKELCPCKVAKV